MKSALLFLLVFVVLLGLARKPRPVENRQGGRIDASQESEINGQSLTVGTFNVQTGKDLNGRRDASRASSVMAGADLLGVQEVYGAGWLNKLGWGLSQTHQFSAAGKFSALFSPTRYRWLRENRGNLILSKLPIEHWVTTMLHDETGKSFRNMTVAKLRWGGEEVVFINTHLHTGTGRIEQLEEVLQEFSIHPIAILVGDFNSKADTKSLSELFGSKRSRIDVIDAIASAGLDLDNEHRIDWIITKGFKVVGGKMLPKGISDHPYYQVELELLTESH